MMSAAFIARSLRGRKSGRGWSAHCPAHDDKHPSLSISDKNGKALFYCHAGCSQRDVIDALKMRGLWEYQQDDFKHSRKTHTELTPEQKKELALKIWEEADSAKNTLVETYLASRGLTIPVPSSLRFHPDLKHFPSGKTYPCMMALITHGIDGTPMAIQRTYLAGDGKGKATIEPNRMMLGFSRGGVIRFGEPDGILMVGEGIETSLSAMAATGHPTWAGMSTSGLTALDLPQSVKKVIVLADGDDRGESAAQKCARRWTQQGRKISIARPPKGKDFNDLLVEKSTHNQL